MASTPVLRIIQNGINIWFEDMARQRHLLCQCRDVEVAHEISDILANYHGVERLIETGKD